MSFLTNISGVWEFETGALTTDSKGGFTLTDHGTIATAAGKVGTAAQFVKATPKWFSKTSAAGLASANGSIMSAMWVYMDSKTTTHNFMGKGTSLYEFAFYYDQPVDQFNFQIVCTDGVTFPSVKWTTFSPSLATWYLILGWWDAVNHQLGIRVNNGTPIVSSPGNSLVIRDTTEDFRIGGNVAGADGVDGRIDQAIFGLKAPTLADMDFIWNGGAGRNFTQMGLSLASLTPVSAPQNTTQTLTLAGTRFRGGDL